MLSTDVNAVDELFNHELKQITFFSTDLGFWNFNFSHFVDIRSELALLPVETH